MINFRKISLFLGLILITNCGYTPLIDSKNNNFFLSNLTLEGDRQINNYITNGLKKFQEKRENAKKYNVEIISEYIKNISNKDDKGNPKNYTIKTVISVKLTSEEGNVIERAFERSTTLSAKDKKIEEKELENKYKKDLSNLLSQDIIFLLRNQ